MLHELNGNLDSSLRLQEISTLLIQEGNLEALYERVLDAAVYLMRADVGSMQRYDPERDELLTGGVSQGDLAAVRERFLG